MQKKYGIILLSVLIVLAVSSCNRGKIVKIGLVGPYSGPVASYAASALEGAKLEFEYKAELLSLNAELITQDDMCDANQSTLVASKLVAEEVVAVIGPMCSDAVVSAMPAYLDAGIAVISQSATAPALTDGRYPGFFRTIVSDDVQGTMLAEFIITTLKSRRVALIHDKSEYGKGLVDVVLRYMEENSDVDIVVYEGITPEALDYSAVISKIISNDGAETVLFGGYHSEASKLFSQLLSRDYEGYLIGGEGIKSIEFIDLVGRENAEGVFASAPKDVFNNDEYARVQANFVSSTGNEPGSFFYETQAAVAVVMDAIAAGNTTGSDIVSYLSSGNTFNTAIGEISFTENGDVVGAGYSMYRVKNGAFELIE